MATLSVMAAKPACPAVVIMSKPDLSDLIGIPFLDGGQDPRIGLDCWGLVREVFRRYGIELPERLVPARDAEAIDRQIDLDRQSWVRWFPPYAVPAVVVFRLGGGGVWCNHTGVLVAPGRFIHARAKTRSCIESLSHPYYSRKLEGIYRPGWLT